MAKKVFAMYLAKEGNPNSDAYLHIRVNDNRIRKLIAPSHGSLD